MATTKKEVEAQEPEVKKPQASNEYQITEGLTTITITGITKKEGDKLAAALKGQIQGSNDFQLRGAIAGHLGRNKVVANAVNIERGVAPKE